VLVADYSEVRLRGYKSAPIFFILGVSRPIYPKCPISESTPAFTMPASSALSNAGSSAPSTPPPQNTQDTQHTPPPQSSQSAPPPQDTQRTLPLQNTQSTTPPNADTSNTDSLVTAADTAAALRILSEDKIRSIGRTSTLIGTKDGPIANQTGASLVSKAKVKFLSNKAWSLTTSE
jgi:hypothetical protein